MQKSDVYSTETVLTTSNIISLHGGQNHVISTERVKLRFEGREKPNEESGNINIKKWVLFTET